MKMPIVSRGAYAKIVNMACVRVARPGAVAGVDRGSRNVVSPPLRAGTSGYHSRGLIVEGNANEVTGVKNNAKLRHP
jgi:hypothetical protein